MVGCLAVIEEAAEGAFYRSLMAGPRDRVRAINGATNWHHFEGTGFMEGTTAPSFLGTEVMTQALPHSSAVECRRYNCVVHRGRRHWRPCGGQR